jgi:hypothetical protein
VNAVSIGKTFIPRVEAGMDLSGKKTDRLRLPRQLNVSGVMALEVKLRAEFSYRSIEDELRWLLMLGIKYEDWLSGNETMGTNAHQISLFGTEPR